VDLALARDPRHALARRRAADVAYHWLLVAERDHDEVLGRELRARLAVVDDGSRQALLSRAARLRVTTSPPGARVALHRVTVRWAAGGSKTPAGRSQRTPP
jgi:hypothetical protein